MAKEGSNGASSAELGGIKKENEKLKATIVKQEYRIRHFKLGWDPTQNKQCVFSSVVGGSITR